MARNELSHKNILELLENYDVSELDNSDEGEKNLSNFSTHEFEELLDEFNDSFQQYRLAEYIGDIKI